VKKYSERLDKVEQQAIEAEKARMKEAKERRKAKDDKLSRIRS